VLPVCDEFIAAGTDDWNIVILGDRTVCVTEMMICFVMVMSCVVLLTL
jgi:hypothetical protein